MSNKKDLQITGMSGELITAGKLFKRGYQVALTMGNAKAIDLFVLNPETDKTYNVQVKTQRSKNCFPLKKECINHDHIFVFVRLNEFADNEEFFILSGKVILENINNFYGSSYRDINKISSMPAINYGSLIPYKNNWAVFEQ